MLIPHKTYQISEGYNITSRLHTDMLEDKYGHISVQVLSDDNITREALLEDQQNIVRTYALTIRNGEWTRDKGMQEVNKDIQSGVAIGKAFKAHGFCICKNIIDVYLVYLPKWLRIAFSHPGEMAKARISEFLVKKDELIYNYGLITEIYSPDFREATINGQDRAQINLPSTILYDMGLTKEQVWRYVEERAKGKNNAPAYASFVTSIKERVSNRIR